MNRTSFFLLVPIFFISFFLLSSHPVMAAGTFYVSTSGTDDVSHGGSADAGAWRTVKYALTGSRMSQGSTLIIQAGTYDEQQTSVALSAGSGTTTIQAAAGETVNLNINNSGVTTTLFFSQKPLTFKHINFTNTYNQNKQFFSLYSADNYVFEDCSFDRGSVSINASSIKIYGDYAENVTFRRCTMKNNYMFITIDGAINKTITFESSQAWDNTVLLYNGGTAGVNLTLKNNTFIDFKGTSNYFFHLANSGSTLFAYNNILTIGGTGNAVFGFNIGSTVASEWIANPALFEVKNNILWNYNSPMSNMDAILWRSVSYFLPADISNKMINPDFTDYDNHVLTLKDTSMAAGRGGATNHPTEGDFNESVYGTNDVGAFVNPATLTLPSVTSDKVIFFGDSIMQGGSGGAVGYEGWRVFNSQTADDSLTVVNSTLTTLGGMGITGGVFLIDKVFLEQAPETIFAANGLGDLNIPPTFQTNNQIATEIIKLLQKIEDYGSRPIWLGLESLDGSLSPDNTNVLAVNELVEAACVSNGWTYGSILDQMMLNPDWVTEYYTDLITDIHPNIAGQALIGHLAEYLYYPHHTLGTSEIYVTNGARVYSDGQFRDLLPIAGSTADLSITPGSGSFVANDSTPWMDITDITWETSGDYSKLWTESSSVIGSGSTIHTVGDLETSTNYLLTYDKGAGSISMGVYQSDSSGEIDFTYTGGYSEVDFSLEEAPTIAISDTTVDEGAGTATVTVTMTGSTANNSVTVNYATSSGTAISGTDFTATSGTLTWTAGQTGAKTFTVTITNDTLDENSETLNLILSVPVNAIISDSAGVMTITDNDATPTVSWTTASQASVNESGTLTVTAQLSAVSGLTVTVPYTMTGAATGSGTDYSITASPITITAGSTTADVTITIVEERIVEPDETVIVTIGSPTNASQGATIIHTATITRDDVSQTYSSPASTVGNDATNNSSSTTPVINLTSPAGGETLIGENTEEITWTTSGSGMDTIGIFYSIDNGVTYNQIVYNISKGLGTYDWVLPNLDSEKVLVKIIAYDSGKAVLDTDVSGVMSIAYFDDGSCSYCDSSPDLTPEGYTSEDSEGRIVATDSGLTGPSPFTGQEENISRVFSGQFIRSYSYNTIYYIDENFIRHPFWDSNSFFTYADSFDEVVWVTDATLPTMTIGTPMLPKAGVVLVKITSDAKTYAIDTGDTLRWVPSESIANTLYGATWADYIIDLEPTIFARFTVGDDMTTSDSVDLSLMKTRMELNETAR